MVYWLKNKTHKLEENKHKACHMQFMEAISSVNFVLASSCDIPKNWLQWSEWITMVLNTESSLYKIWAAELSSFEGEL